MASVFIVLTWVWVQHILSEDPDGQSKVALQEVPARDFFFRTIIIYESTYENTLPLKNTAQTTQ
jgi:hypothetical protein